MDLSAFGPGLHATARLLHLRDYDPAFVVVYKVGMYVGSVDILPVCSLAFAEIEF